MRLDLLTTLAPYFAAFIAWRFEVPQDETEGQALAERTFILFAYFAIWNQLLKYALDLYRYRKIDNDPTQSTIKQIKIWFLFLLLLGSMELLRLRIEREQFVFMLSLLPLLAGSLSGRINDKPWLALVCTILSHLGVAYASFVVINHAWAWQPLLFAVCLGSASATLTMFRWWSTKPEIEPRARNRYVRILTTIALASPVSIGVLALTHQIPYIYMLVYTTLFWLSKIASSIEKREISMPEVSNQLSKIFCAMLAILVGCRIWEHYH